MASLALVGSLLLSAAAEGDSGDTGAASARPVRLIFDTDIGNDVDDALALGVIHALQSRGECELLAVTTTKDHELCGPFVDAVNTFYRRPGIPIGVVRDGATPEEGRFLGLARERDGGALRYPHDLASGTDAPEAVALLREVLAAQPDHSVAIAQVGFSTNLARLLDSGPDTHSPLSGRDLAAGKVALLSVMAGVFHPTEYRDHREYNVVNDIPAAQKIAAEWPSPVVLSGFEIGVAIPYPAASIKQDFAYVAHHPLAEAYQLYQPVPHERPTWDLTSVLYAVRPSRGYFTLSAPGRWVVSEEGRSSFEEAPDGTHRYLIVDAAQIVRAREALAQLASQPPCAAP
ncbi:MAG: nucleoside hydrolase [Candidatus Hydrogenedentes bacterium]|nr:nucleoside hydrolase [Candidatus Hydrogenedentota bacterium]